ncbi:MAG: hypothetical protein J6S57_00190 [Alphaproteobacteria bacterium]|nr:hypothetical protein [Alphaproteobacteria bacterium]
MNEIGNFAIENLGKCWACPVFDNLFSIVSNAAASMYKQLANLGIIIFCILFAFYIINVVWENIKTDTPDLSFQKSVKPVVIKSLIALALLGMGLQIPRLISKITFEPVAMVTLEFSNSMIHALPSNSVVSTDYTPIQLNENGFFSPQLRDTILQLIQTSVTNFQGYIKLGINVIDSSFSISSLFWIGSLLKHMIVFFIGLILTYNFAKLFIKYSFCFLDIIIAMAMFAFFFPLSLIFFIFKGASSLPGWMGKLGGDLGSGQIKNLINAIVSVAATILTYTIIMMLISGYLDGTDLNSFDSTSYESLFDFDLENSSAMQITFAGSIVLIYIIKYIADQIPEITKKILSVFNVSENDSLSKAAGDDALQLTKLIGNGVKNLATNIINPDASGEVKNGDSTKTK